MTPPTIPTVAAGRVLTAVQANATSPRTFPSLSSLTKNAGDRLIAICVAYQSSAAGGAVFGTWGGGFTEIADLGGTTSNMSIGVAEKISTGSETGTFTVTQAATITGHAAMILLSISGAHASTASEVSAIVHGTAAAANPASFDPAGWAAEDTLWIAVAGSGETAITGTWTGVGATAPTNYTDLAAAAPADTSTVGQADGAVAFRQLNATAEDVGTFASVDVSNARNSALVIAVRPDSTVFITGTSGGVGTSSGALTAASMIAGSSGGAGTTSGALTVPTGHWAIVTWAQFETPEAVTGSPLSGSTSGGGSTTGALTATPQFVGVTAGAGTVAGALAAIALVTASTTGTGTTTGALTATALLGGTAAGTGTATGTAAATALLVGTASGSGTTTGAPSATGTPELSGSSVGAGATAGALTVTGKLTGTTIGSGTTTGDLMTMGALTGFSLGVGSALANLQAASLIAGNSAGVGTVTGLPTTPVPPSGGPVRSQVVVIA